MQQSSTSTQQQSSKAASISTQPQHHTAVEQQSSDAAKLYRSYVFITAQQQSSKAAMQQSSTSTQQPIQKLCFQGAKATKISIFWYPKTRPKQLSGRAGAKMGWGGGAKPAARQPSWCQDAKISRFPSRAKPSGPTGRVSLGCLGGQKSTILVPRYQNG